MVLIKAMCTKIIETLKDLNECHVDGQYRSLEPSIELYDIKPLDYLLNIYKNTFIYVKRIYIFPNFVYIITQKKRIPLLPGIRIFFYILY